MLSRLCWLSLCCLTSCTPLEIFAVEETAKIAEDIIDEAEEDFDRDIDQAIHDDLIPRHKGDHKQGRAI